MAIPQSAARPNPNPAHLVNQQRDAAEVEAPRPDRVPSPPACFGVGLYSSLVPPPPEPSILTAKLKIA